MGADYYSILGVARGATPGDIKKAYRELSMKYHPDRNRGNEDWAHSKFKEISEAHAVLSDSEKRRTYDLRGLGGANFGGFGFGTGGVPQFNANIFENIMRDFGGEGVFFDPGSKPRATATPRAPRKDTTRTIELELSLEEVLKGITRTEKFTRRVPDGQREREEEKTVEVVVKPGLKSGTKFTFDGVGDQSPGRAAGDVVFIVKDKAHRTFTREGNDIKCTVAVTLVEALCGTTVQIPTLEGKNERMEMLQGMRPNDVTRIKGRGLPDPKEPNKRGDIIVHFDILFPDLDESQKSEIKTLLK